MTLASRRFRGLNVDVELVNCWQESLLKKELVKHESIGFSDDFSKYFLRIQDRGKTQSVALADVLYLRAELKYITVCTVARHFILSGTLAALEARLPGHFIRIHRNTLVARQAAVALSQLAQQPDKSGHWVLRLKGARELLPVSRRQLSALRNSLIPCCAAPQQCR
jgi:two-component system response regulator AlgR